MTRGTVVAFQLELSGLKDEAVPVRWSLFDAKTRQLVGERNVSLINVHALVDGLAIPPGDLLAR